MNIGNIFVIIFLSFSQLIHSISLDEHLNISIKIIGSSIEVPSEYLRKELARYTNMFIQHFIFREVSDLEKSEVKMIKENYSRMAHKWQKDTNRTILAARRDVMNEILPQLTSATRHQRKTLATPTFSHPIAKKQETSSTPVREEPIEENVHALPYSIENSVHLPFLSPSNAFPDRLRTYLFDTFEVKLEIKPISSTKIVLDLKGQHKDVSNARVALNSLFASLKTKTYSDKFGCKFPHFIFLTDDLI